MVGQALKDRVENDFTYHPPKPGQSQKYEEIRGLGKAFALRLLELCPAGWEQALALTKLEEVVFWSNAAIARNP